MQQHHDRAVRRAVFGDRELNAVDLHSANLSDSRQPERSRDCRSVHGPGASSAAARVLAIGGELTSDQRVKVDRAGRLGCERAAVSMRDRVLNIARLTRWSVLPPLKGLVALNLNQA